MRQPPSEMKLALWKAGLTYHDVALKLGRTYSIISAYMNQQARMPEEVKRAIVALIAEQPVIKARGDK